MAFAIPFIYAIAHHPYPFLTHTNVYTHTHTHTHWYITNLICNFEILQSMLHLLLGQAVDVSQWLLAIAARRGSRGAGREDVLDRV